MCIALLSTSHPQYPFILLSNRDEFLNRPTARADWWAEPHQQVLGGRDLQRQEKGTWLGITKQGRIAILTNFREEGVEITRDKSRGGIVNAYLTTPPADEESAEAFAERLMKTVGIHDVGGFSLLYGQLQPVSEEDRSLGELSILSNRTKDPDHLVKLAGKVGETHGLSNSHFGDLSWPKVVHGEQMLKQAIKAHTIRDAPEAQFIESLFDILSVDTLPKKQAAQPWHEFARQLRNSILIPPSGGEEKSVGNANDTQCANDVAAATNGTTGRQATVGEGVYGTQKQTVILVDRDGRVVFTERTMFDGKGEPVPIAQRDRRFEFIIGT